MILVYQAYGREDVIRQSMFSIVSLLCEIKEASGFEVWVYTDVPTRFAEYFGDSIRVVPITSEQIKRWRGAIDFVHRVKVEILRDAASKTSDSLFYVDGDTFFRHDPLPLFRKVDDRHSLMHVAENALDEGRDPLSKKIAKFVKKHTFQVNGERVQLPPNTVMWNAGALGLSHKNKELLPFVLELTDQMYGTYQKHIMEQLAFSYVLQTRTEILCGEEAIGHYWNQKPAYQAAIDEFLARNSNLAMARADYRNFVHPAPVPAGLQPGGKKSFWPSWLRF